MKNSLLDLNNHLFSQLERLGDESLKGEKLELEINRSKAFSSVAKEVISNARLVLDANVKKSEFINQNQRLPSLLSVEHKDG